VKDNDKKEKESNRSKGGKTLIQKEKDQSDQKVKDENSHKRKS
jgi:hypothetical protein